MIIDRLLDDLERFNEIRRTIPLISAKVLVDNLTSLEEEGILKREVYPTPPISVRYRLTEKRLDLTATMEAMRRWGERWLAEEPGM